MIMRFKNVIAVAVVVAFAVTAGYQVLAPYIYLPEDGIILDGVFDDTQEMLAITFEVYSGLLGVIVGHYFYQKNHKKT